MFDLAASNGEKTDAEIPGPNGSFAQLHEHRLVVKYTGITFHATLEIWWRNRGGEPLIIYTH